MPPITKSSTKGIVTLEAADIIRLIHAHLTECGLQSASRALREESGIGAAGVTRAAHANLKPWALRGDWGHILETLSTLDRTRQMTSELLADVHEMAILELAEVGQMALAYAALQVVQDELDQVPAHDATTIRSHNNDTNNVDPPQKKEKHTKKSTEAKADEYTLTRKRDLEQRLAALVSLRSSSTTDVSTKTSALPPDYYGPDAITKQERREDIGQRLAAVIPIVPQARLSVLLQQAIKWQAYTGELPMVRNQWDDDEAIPAGQDNYNDRWFHDDTRPRKRTKKMFDLVLGDVDLDPVTVGEAVPVDAIPLDPIPSQPWGSPIKFGKKATAEAAIFVPNATHNNCSSATTFSLATGSSDGLVELWDAQTKYSRLRSDLAYQEQDECMGHDDTPVLALAASRDGTMLATGAADGTLKVWRIDTGKCLRSIVAHERAISCLDFSPDASHVITASHDGKAREFGLRTSRMLKEFHGHASYVTTVQYVLTRQQMLYVVTSSADGTVRIWNAKTSEIVRVLRPVSLGDALSNVDGSIVVDPRSDLASSAGESPTVASVCFLHTPPETIIIVPRGLRAFLVDFQGKVLRIFQDTTSAGGSKAFVAATVSPSNHWLYAVTEDGVCCVFDILTAKLEKAIRNFGLETSSKAKDRSKLVPEISGIVHHPHKGIIAAFSNDKGQKKGQLVLWK